MFAGLLALCLIFVPLAAGIGLGQLIPQRLLRLVVLTVPIPLTVAMAVRFRVGVWDGAFVGAMFVLGFWWSGWPKHERRARTGLGVSAAVLAFAIAEGFARSERVVVPGLPEKEVPTLVLPQVTTPDLHNPDIRDQWPPNAACAMLFPDEYPEILNARLANRQNRQQTIMHVGDSMVFGWGVPSDKAFPALLQAQDASADHINGSLPNTTIDFELLLIERWIQKVPTHLVVLYPFAGSDLVEMDEAFPCCHDGPLLTYDGDQVRPRCARPDFSVDDRSFSWIRHHSPAPEPIRAAADWSELAHQAALAFRHDIRADQSPKEQWKHYEAALRSLRDTLAQQQVRLLVVVLPALSGLDAPPLADDDPVHRTDQTREIAHALADLSRQLSLDTIDASPFIYQLLKEGPPERWFVGDRIHFSVETHERFARWLQPQINKRLNP